MALLWIEKCIICMRMPGRHRSRGVTLRLSRDSIRCSMRTSILLLLLPSLSFAQPAPEVATRFTPKAPAYGRHFTVTAAAPSSIP